METIKLLIGVWVCTGALRNHDFREFYIHYMDFSYSDIPAPEQVLIPGLEGWIMSHATHWCKQKGGIYNMYPSAWMIEAQQRCVCIHSVYTEKEQEELFTLLLNRDYKENRG